MTSSSKGNQIYNDIIETHYSFKQLQPCSQYCFTIVPMNIIGAGDKSDKICTYTKAGNDRNNVSVSLIINMQCLWK